MSTFLERLENEIDKLRGRLLRLNEFIVSEKFNNIDEIQQILLNVQEKAMQTYLQCLRERLFQLK